MGNDSLIKRLAKLEEKTQADGKVSRIELVAICPTTHQPVGEPVTIWSRKARRSA